jgi:hypothetical protein
MGIYDYLDRYTAAELLRTALQAVNASVDKREGAVIFDTLSPLSVVAGELMAMLKEALTQTDFQTASGSFLDLAASQHGVYRRHAIASHRIAQATPQTIDIDIGTIFQTSQGLGLFWRVTDMLSLERYVLICETAGSDGGRDYGELTAQTPIIGLESMEFIETLNQGSDAESNMDLRIRVWESLSSDAYGGNFSDYKIWCFDLFANHENGAMLDGMLFFPSSRHLGGGTIMIMPTVMIDGAGSFMPASSSVCDRLKEFIDPPGASGMGAGVAPVGHRVTVNAPEIDVWNIQLQLRLFPQYESLPQSAVDDLKNTVLSFFEYTRKNGVTSRSDNFPYDGYKISIIRNRLEADIFNSSTGRQYIQDILSISRDYVVMDLSYEFILTSESAALPSLGTFNAFIGH